jgi:hypothetical protein
MTVGTKKERERGREIGEAMRSTIMHSLMIALPKTPSNRANPER